MNTRYLHLPEESDWFDCSALVRFEPDLPRFALEGFDEDPIPLVRRAARPLPHVPGLVLVAPDDSEDTIPWLPTWTILGVPCLRLEPPQGAAS